MSSRTNRNTVDYAGRTVDLLLLKTVTEVPTVNHRVGLDVSGTPMIVSGVEKLVQRYALSFINAMGSTMFRQSHGTELIPNVSAGLVYDMATLEANAAEANLLAANQVKAGDEESESPDDERLDRADVTDLEYDRSRALIRITVKLTTMAGGTYVYIIPVGVGVH